MIAILPGCVDVAQIAMTKSNFPIENTRRMIARPSGGIRIAPIHFRLSAATTEFLAGF